MEGKSNIARETIYAKTGRGNNAGGKDDIKGDSSAQLVLCAHRTNFT